MEAKSYWEIVLAFLGLGLLLSIPQTILTILYGASYLNALSVGRFPTGEGGFFAFGILSLIVFSLMAIAGFVGWWKKKRFGYYLVLFMAGFGSLFGVPYESAILIGLGNFILFLVVLIFTFSLLAAAVFLIIKSRKVFGITEKRNSTIALAVALVLGLLAGTGLILAPSSGIFSALSAPPCRTTVVEGDFSKMCLQLEDVGSGYSILYQESQPGEISETSFEKEDGTEQVGCGILPETTLKVFATDEGLKLYKASVERWKDYYSIEKIVVEDFEQFGVKGFNYSLKRKELDSKFESSLRFYFENVWVIITIVSEEEMPPKERIANYAQTVLKRLQENTKEQKC